MTNSLIIAAAYTFLIVLSWLGMDYFFVIEGKLFYAVAALPVFLMFFGLVFDSLQKNKLLLKRFREIKRQEIEKELQDELWWWIPSELREKWLLSDRKNQIDLYQKKMELWKDP